VAFVVGEAIGLEVTDAARKYIHLYRGDGAALAESLGLIQQTGAAILTAIGIGDVASADDSRSVV
jgi:hypothetical protein